MPGVIATSQASIGAAAASLVGGRTNRRLLTVRNTHATQTLFVGPDASVTVANGHAVPAGTLVELYSYTGALFAIASGAATTVTVLELAD